VRERHVRVSTRWRRVPRTSTLAQGARSVPRRSRGAPKRVYTAVYDAFVLAARVYWRGTNGRKTGAKSTVSTAERLLESRQDVSTQRQRQSAFVGRVVAAGRVGVVLEALAGGAQAVAVEPRVHLTRGPAKPR